ncbi:MAG: tetratricopeptide repeat protein [Pirellulales bacterium]
MANSASPWVVNTTAATFAQDVWERSQTVPVVVDFWAEWCAPCRMLGPILESLAEEAAGQFVLVKAETEQLPEQAAEFQVQGIPAVYAVVGGQVVDFFVGALPKEQIREWLGRLQLAADVARAKSLETSAPAEAEQVYRSLIPQLPNEWDLQIGLGRALAAQGQDDQVRAILEKLERRGFLEPEAEKLKAALELKSQNTPSVDECRAAAAAAPHDLDKQLQLGEALAAAQQYQESLDVLLAVVRADRKGAGEKARQVMVDIFRVLPGDSDLVRDYRRKLSSALY